MSCNQIDRAGYCGITYCGYNMLDDNANVVSRDDIDKLRNCQKPRRHAGYICVGGNCKKGTLYDNYVEVPDGSLLNRYCYVRPSKSIEDCCFGRYDNELECPDGYCKGEDSCTEYLKKVCNQLDFKNLPECQFLYTTSGESRKCRAIKTHQGWKCDTSTDISGQIDTSFDIIEDKFEGLSFERIIFVGILLIFCFIILFGILFIL